MDPHQTGGGESTPPPPPPPYGQQPYGQAPHAQQAPLGQQPPQPAGGPPPNYLVWAILSTLFCCLPLGVVSIVFAAQVNGKYAAGDIAGANASSNKAKQFAIGATVAGVVVIGVYLLAIAAGGDV